MLSAFVFFISVIFDLSLHHLYYKVICKHTDICNRCVQHQKYIYSNEYTVPFLMVCLFAVRPLKFQKWKKLSRDAALLLQQECKNTGVKAERQYHDRSTPPHTHKDYDCSGSVFILWGGHFILAAVWWLGRCCAADRTCPLTQCRDPSWCNCPTPRGSQLVFLLAWALCVSGRQGFLAGTPQHLLQNCRALGHLQCRSLYIATELQGERGGDRETEGWRETERGRTR